MPNTEKIIHELTRSYWMELETVQNYLANATNLDGVRAEEIKKALSSDVGQELTHAQQLAARIRVLGGVVPGSFEFKAAQTTLQPPKDSTDVIAVIKGAIDAEEGAIGTRRSLNCDGEDDVTQDLCIELLTDEESHRREFIGFLREYEK